MTAGLPVVATTSAIARQAVPQDEVHFLAVVEC